MEDTVKKKLAIILIPPPQKGEADFTVELLEINLGFDDTAFQVRFQPGANQLG
jgi:hypothetical protein